jgi:MmgE/PrpD C-terminal domain
VEIETRDGRMLLGDASDRIGSPGQPLSDAQLEEKFRGLAEPVIGASAARIREIVATLENLPDVRELADLLRCAT